MKILGVIMRLLIVTVTIILISFNVRAGFFHKTPVGKKNDVILEIWSDILNEWNEVVLIFGYDDNYENCEIIKNYLVTRYNRKYRCSVIK